MSDTETAENTENTENALNVTEEELALLTRFRQAGQDCIRELGLLEVRRARILGNYGQLEAASQNHLKEIRDRLGIAEGSEWTIKPDGSVVVGASDEGADTTEG